MPLTCVGMEIITLGTGTPIPSPDRAGSSTLIKAGGLNLLFDCGRGVLMRLAGAGVPTPLMLAGQFLTHLHSDHTTDYNDVITTRWATAPVPQQLRVFGPVGTQLFTERTLAALEEDIGYRMAHHDDLTEGPDVAVSEIVAGPVFDEGGVTISAQQTDHKPVHPTIGYRVEHEGKSAVIAGDTVPCEGLDRLCDGADVYVQTVLRRSAVEAFPFQRARDTIDYHSDLEDAGRTAAKAGVGAVVLTHLWPPPAPGQEDDYIAEVAKHYDGRIELAHDLFSIEV